MIKRMNKPERESLAHGALFVGLITGAVSYLNYRFYLQKEFYRSEGHYRLGQTLTNMTPYKQLYFTWWRMPRQEFEVYHRFTPYYIMGQLDQSKEILIPKQKIINGQKQDGYIVISPLYCYEGGRFSLKNAVSNEDPVLLERAAFIVNRGWIPEQLKDKLSRPIENNSRKLQQFKGVFRAGKNLHDYKYPNNPDNNEWHNLALEDIGLYWELPNFDEIKHYYFELVDLPGHESENHQYPVPAKPDELIDDHYGWKFNESVNYKSFLGFGAVSALSFGLFFMA